MTPKNPIRTCRKNTSPCCPAIYKTIYFQLLAINNHLKEQLFSRKFHFTFAQTTSKPDCERNVRSRDENRTRKHEKGAKFQE
ncbi:Hypothetical protein GOX1186 [Gluconobacter oxydans 621H]|uniref:Uncharacterized protein n=1 Tax=Gluconobacter oxydans (strain 621H) TaxID=290633 RepID=Q5FRP9_GLUOX|nr:Hypothetical protein GOX1186 [Gluconobacter oxydans 621H]